MVNTRSKKKKENLSQEKPFLVPKPILAHLPHDIILEILTFLPLKALFKFKCVCKSWLFLTSNSRFIKTHLSKSSVFKNFTNQRLILRHFGYGNFLKSCSLASEFCSAVKIDYPSRNRSSRVFIVGSCNGLLCIATEKLGVLLLNPSTRISKKVPVSDIKFQLDSLTNYGFGYDVRNDDYKLVWIVSVLTGGFVPGKKDVKVYSLKTKLWKKIGDFPQGIRSHDRGKYVNGVLHWAVISTTDSDSDSPMVILSLDLDSETFGEIAQPCYGESKITSLCLGVMEGCLAIFCHFEKSCCDIWVMKVYGVWDTWIKLFTIPYRVDLEFSSYYPLCICKSGEILLEFRWHLYLYDPRNGKFRDPKIGNLRGTLAGLDTITYVESLISPYVGDEAPAPQI